MNLFQIAYDLINTYLFGGSAVAGTYFDLVCIELSSIACIFVISLPFALVWRCIKMWF